MEINDSWVPHKVGSVSTLGVAKIVLRFEAHWKMGYVSERGDKLAALPWEKRSSNDQVDSVRLRTNFAVLMTVLNALRGWTTQN